MVKYAQAQYEESDQARQVRRKVAEAISLWANSEGFTNEEAELGLALATETVALHGLSNEALAELRFDPKQAADKVVTSARENDPYWGTENHYQVAARGIEVTYDALIKQLQASHDVLIPVFQALHDLIDTRAALTQNMTTASHVRLGELVEALVAVSTVSEVMSYLRTRIADWDVSAWHQDQRAAVLERLLWVHDQTESIKGGQYLSAEDALARQQMLVVKGGPGAGKTWLARRYARRAAQTALSQLEGGVSLDEVELPLLTTWEKWAKTEGVSPMQSLVEASFASGLGHRESGNGDSVDRLRRTFLRPQARVLLLVDSLDEAADLTAQAPRLHELIGLPARWRVVVTSRPAAWDATYRRSSSRAAALRVVTLRDLTYPEDVEAFIHSWFVDSTDAARGQSLIQEIRDRTELARAAVVPLMLTFYCLLAEDPREAAEPLPARRRVLYRRLVRRLLSGGWTAGHPGPDAAPDWGYCEGLLRNWAWQAVENGTNAAGLGVWEDSFIQPTIVRKTERRAIDHVAPKMAVDDEGNITRRFVHRTFLEHFVAEHIATLEASEAADLLLPHLWFDPDWKVSAPAAIIAHNQQQPGALLEHLLQRILHPEPDSARNEAYGELERLLLTVAQESEPDEWTREHQNLLHKCRGSNATNDPDPVIRSAHWTFSNQDARAAMLQALSIAEASDVVKLARGLEALQPTDAELAQARTVVLEEMPVAQPWEVCDLAEALGALRPTHAERAQVRTVVLENMSGVFGVRNVARALSSLEATDIDRAQARAVLLEAPLTRLEDSVDVAEALAALVTNEAERFQARTEVMQGLSAAGPWKLVALAEALRALKAPAAEQAQARTAVLHALPDADPEVTVNLAKALAALNLTESEQAQARTAVLHALPDADPKVAVNLAKALAALNPTEPEQAQARTAVLHALPDADPKVAVNLAKALAALNPTEPEQAQARTAVLHALPTPDPPIVIDMVAALVGLEVTAAGKAKARAAVLQALPTGDLAVVMRGAGWIRALVTTDIERAQARTTVLQALLTAATPGNVVYWTGTRVSLEDDRVVTKVVVVQTLSTPEPGSVCSLAEALIELMPSDTERAQARAAVLQTLSSADTKDIEAKDLGGLVAALRALSSVESWLAWLNGGLPPV
ncbi:UNVERIFIED_ORG: hypothetical protein J2X79_004356 [Arthrobacter globiformis]|nr:hypothetical protein [Arthrobacter globiformis]